MNSRLKTLQLSGKWVSVDQAATAHTGIIHWRGSKENANGSLKPAKELLCRKERRRDYICFFPLKAECKHLDL